MTNQVKKTIGILGLACRFGSLAGLADFWYDCVNGKPRIPAIFEGEKSGPGVLQLPEIIRKAAEDAEILSDNGFPEKTLFLIHHDRPMGKKNRDRLIVQSGWDRNAVQWFQSEAFPLNGIQEAMEVLETRAAMFVILATLTTGPVPRCAAVVLGLENKASSKKAYARIQSFQFFKKKTLRKKLEELAGKGLGYLGFCGKDLSETAEATKELHDVFTWEKKAGRIQVPSGIFRREEHSTGQPCMIAGLIRMAMALNNKILLPSDDPQPFPWKEEALFYSNTELRPWIQDTRSISRQCALVAGQEPGRMALMVMGEVPSSDPSPGFLPKPVITAIQSDSELIALSAPTREALIRRVEILLAFLESHAPALEDVAGFLSTQFVMDHPFRLALVAEDLSRLKALLKACKGPLNQSGPDFSGLEDIYFTSSANCKAGKLACLFPGLGFPGLLGDYADHLMTLCLHFPEFRQVFDNIDLRDKHPDDPTPTNRLFFPPAAFSEENRKILRGRMASPRMDDYATEVDPARRNLASFGVAASNWAGWRLFQKLNIIPDALFGQSLGELSSLCAGGALDFDTFIRIYWEASLDPEHYTNRGRLAIAGTNALQLEPFFEKYQGVSIAIHVARDLQILGGEALPLEAMVTELKAAGVWTQLLPYPAIHTPKLTELRPVMEPYLTVLPINPFQIPVYSGMTCEVYPDDPDRIREIMIANIDYPVRLWQTENRMYEDGVRIMVQVGGGASMYSHARTNVAKDDLAVFSIDVDYRSAFCQLNHLCAGLLQKGVNVQFQVLLKHRYFNSRAIEAFFQASEASAGKKPLYTHSGVKMPFIGEILEYEENAYILMERNIDVNQDLYIRDHLFVNADSVKPVSACLPVVPMTLSVEMMAEAAACLAPGYGLVGFENIRASQWIGLADTESITTRIRARFSDLEPQTGILRVEAAILPSGSNKPSIEAKVLLARRYCENLVLDFTPIEGEFRFPFKGDEIYREKRLFHGPVFHCIKGDPAFAGNKVIGELEVPDKSGILSYQPEPELLTDPILLDGVGQLVGLWAIDNGEYVFPVGINKLEIYRPSPPVGTRVPVLVEIKSNGAKLLSADVEIQDGEGRVWMRIRDWKYWVFRWPKPMMEFRRQPEYYLVSRILSVPDQPGGAVMQYISMGDMKDSDFETMVRFVSHESELEPLMRIQDKEARWRTLLERFAVKDAIRRWMAGGSQKMMHPASMILEEIENGEFALKYPEHGDPGPVARMTSSSRGALAMVGGSRASMDLKRILVIVEKPDDPMEREA
jgi:hypothetical protein